MAKKTVTPPAPKASKCRKSHPCAGPRKLIAVVAMGLVVAAVVKEMQKAPEERTWNGFVAGLVPYDFRVPDVDKVKSRLWNPEGPVLGKRIFGVGWTVNFGRVVEEIKALPETDPAE